MAGSTRRYVNLEPYWTLCHLVQIKDAVNFDLHLFEDNARYRDVIQEHYHFQTLDPATLTLSVETSGVVYRARLSGILVREVADTERRNAVLAEIQHQLIRWSDITGGIFLCQAGSIDIYSRMLVQLMDPVSGLSIGDYLIYNYPDFFESYTGGLIHPRY